MPARKSGSGEGAERFVVITGGPGAGKSTLVETLQNKGFATMQEAGRALIREQVALDGPALPWKDPVLFGESILQFDIRSYRMAEESAAALVFFDRGIPDLGGGLRRLGMPIPPHVEAAIARFPYRRRVFVAPPWPEIYVNDAERKQSYAEAVATHDAMRWIYDRYGYELVTLPRARVEERVAFVLERV